MNNGQRAKQRLRISEANITALLAATKMSRGELASLLKRRA